MSYWIRGGPKASDWWLSKKRKGHRPGEEREVTVEVDVGVMQVQVRGHPGLPGATGRCKSQGRILRARGSMTPQRLELVPGLQNNISVVRSNF